MASGNIVRSYDPRVQTPQGTQSDTFSAPSIDTDLTIPELFRYHATNSPLHPVFVYANDENEQVYLRYAEVHRAIQKAATYSSPHLKHLTDKYTETEASMSDINPPVIGVLANADTITFYTFLIGLMYLSTTPFPISTRNSPAAVANLASKTGLATMFVSADDAMQRLAAEANDILRPHGRQFDILPMPLFDRLYSPGNDENTVQIGPVRPDKASIVLHSSGSTAFPKPIKFIDSAFRKWGAYPHFGEVDMCGTHLGIQAAPMFHAMGGVTINWTIFSGMVMAVMKPSNPPVVPTPEAYLDSVIATRCQRILCVPALIEAWARSGPETIEKAKTLSAVLYAGAPINKQIGDRLAEAGIVLMPIYGCTESGCLTRLFRKQESIHPSEWEYFEASPQIETWFIPQKGQPGTYEPFVFESPTFSPNVFNTIYDDRPAFATSDLLQQHPTKPHLFRVFGRADDQIALSTGEKINPEPLEAILLDHPRVQACLMFGRGRTQSGVLVQPTEDIKLTDEMGLAAFCDDIWPSVERLNAGVPPHARISKKMIIVSNPAKPLEFTAKGTPRRQVCLAAYQDEINVAYERVQKSLRSSHAAG